MSDSDHAYIARKPCGCIVAATVDRPEYLQSVARDVRDWNRRGLTVEHTTVGEARARPNFLVDCNCENEPQKESLFDTAAGAAPTTPASAEPQSPIKEKEACDAWSHSHSSP
jgi:hypothetical protein